MNAQLRQRSGSVLVCVLVCLLIVTGLAASMVTSTLQARQTVRQERQLVQAQFLLEAGIQRAIQELGADADYTGETWRLTEEVIPGYDSGFIEIKISSAAGDASSSVEVTAQLPADSPLSVRRSYTFTVSNEE